MVLAAGEVSEDGQSFTAEYTIEFTEDGVARLASTAPAQVTGTRINVEPMGTPVGSLDDLFTQFEEEEGTEGTEAATDVTEVATEGTEGGGTTCHRGDGTTCHRDGTTDHLLVVRRSRAILHDGPVGQGAEQRGTAGRGMTDAIPVVARDGRVRIRGRSGV